jgi:CysZ protein
MKGNPILGFGYLIKGLGLITQPGLRLFVIVPLLINITIFSLFVWFSVQQFSGWINGIIEWLPDWLSFIASAVEWLLWPLLVFTLGIVVTYTFSILANLIASPFNALLAEKVEERLTGQPVYGYETLGKALLGIPKGIARELLKILYYLPRLLVVLILSLIIAPAAPLLWFLLGAWMLAIQYGDYPMDNHLIGFKQVITNLKAQRMTSLGFGSGVMLGTMIPIVNFIIMPVAVCGATVYWVEQMQGPANDAIAHQQ